MATIDDLHNRAAKADADLVSFNQERAVLAHQIEQNKKRREELEQQLRDLGYEPSMAEQQIAEKKRQKELEVAKHEQSVKQYGERLAEVRKLLQ